ncbi:hypothetical protein B296_00017540 [Ensete ventricosum]|uniref:Uncharacterized protein n=1 Tax=Ensete ventricosum TaxID=4639 RepID=A0A427AGN5_ENSVE|nr:hypothetical protein B296_00017540 [Ensete ventricosum]
MKSTRGGQPLRRQPPSLSDVDEGRRSWSPKPRRIASTPPPPRVAGGNGDAKTGAGRAPLLNERHVKVSHRGVAPEEQKVSSVHT